MTKLKTKISTVFCAIILVICGALLMACSSPATITSIEKTSTIGLVDTYTIFYSDGSTYEFSITNGEDGVNGQDGKSISIQDIYNQYVEEYGDISYAEFLEEYLNINLSDNSQIINRCLLSSMKVYSEFTISSSYGYGPNQTTVKSISLSSGSAVIYKIEEDYTYILTNYHVVFNNSANSDCENSIAYKIYGYLYGSEGSPIDTGSKDTKGYPTYNYGDYGIALEYIGGTIDYDIAVLKAPTESLTNINDNILATTIADTYYVGETAIAIGNPEDEGISVSEGIISVDNEFISLSIDSTSRNYRSIRIDTAIYSGSSGGGLFNNRGELIGITNAGDTSDQNINYAIPIDIVKNVADNILFYYNGDTISEIHKITLGITIFTSNSKYEYDAVTGYGKIVEDVIISSVLDDSIASELGLQKNDIIKSISINDTQYTIDRYFDIGDIILQIREGDSIQINYQRESTNHLTDTYVIQNSDIS